MVRPAISASVFMAVAFLLARSMAQVNGTPAKCNGSADYCRLPFDQYTFAGTHNSAAYNLTPDCSGINKCENAQKFCGASEDKCTKGWTDVCTKTESKCTKKLPGPFKVLCKGWSKVCTATSKVCNGWEKVCTAPISVCTKGLPMMCGHMPQWARECFWENQRGHSIGKQLEDGIRLFDVDTCVDNSGRVVTCHGEGPTRALGAPLDTHLAEVRKFLNENPGEVIVLEYGDYDGDRGVTARGIKQKLDQYLSGMLFERKDASAPWPTLGEMVQQNKRVVVIFGRHISAFEEASRPAWMLDRDTYLQQSWNYARYAVNDVTLKNSFIKHATETSADEKLWQCIDYGYDIVASTVINDLKHLQQPAICLNVVTAYITKFTHLHRVKVDYYDNTLGLLKEAVEYANRINLTRIKASA
ncbi:PLC-like phosphodiesterase [Syncephalis fuscata]|nr:PLC-like phosphodiesterase [Syncephalis fuscata]